MIIGPVPKMDQARWRCYKSVTVIADEARSVMCAESGSTDLTAVHDTGSSLRVSETIE